jgi:N-acetylglucosaminyldiphosphoundecaprenol N-acetyl-beta-D-mannosaminyltransferase
MLGGEPSIVERAAANIQKHYSLLPKVHFYSPPFAPLDEFDKADILRRIEAAKPDIVLMAFGCQKQEKWISMNYKQADVPLMIGVGATIDFLAGKLAGTPRWIARLGLEWMYRLLQELRLQAGRYWKDIVFLIRQSLRELSAINAPTAPHKLVEPAIEKNDEIAFLNWCGALTAARAHPSRCPPSKKFFLLKCRRSLRWTAPSSALCCSSFAELETKE